MKKSQQGCIACAAKARGATTWEVGYIVGSHVATAYASSVDPDDVDIKLCALHERMSHRATLRELAPKAVAGRQAIEDDAKASDAKGPAK